jgi:tetratricopeptide (TPR) repeat protein
VLGAAVGLLALLIHSWSDFNMHVPANAIVAVTLMALLSGYLRFATEGYWLRMGLLTRILGTTVLVAGLLYLGQQTGVWAHEYAWLQRAAKERTQSSQRLAALKHAAALQPTNFETTCEIGETLRQLSWEGMSGYRELAAEALGWFKTGIMLNPYDAYNYARAGMCLDWLGQYDEAALCFERAYERDPNSHYQLALRGWHCLQIGEYAEAKRWLQRSLELHHPWRNPMAVFYLKVAEQRLQETPPQK